MERRNFLKAGLLASSAGILAACGADDPPPGSTGTGTGGGTGPDQIALYKGADRQAILEEGARKEGALTFWPSSIGDINDQWKAEFEKKYPFINVTVFRADSAALNNKIYAEYGAGKYTVDVFETSPITMSGSWIKDQLLQPFWSPELEAYPTEIKQPDGYYCQVLSAGCSMGFNTKTVSKEEAPKSWDDLLDPKWKGRMAVPSSSTSLYWVGAVEAAKGADYLKNLVKTQEIRMVNGSGQAVLDLVASGEVEMCPSIFAGQVRDLLSANPNASVDWVPIPPVLMIGQAAALASKPPHPYSAMLFIDYLLSEAGATLIHSVLQQDAYRKGVPQPTIYPTTYEQLHLDTVKDLSTALQRWSDLRTQIFTK